MTTLETNMNTTRLTKFQLVSDNDKIHNTSPEIWGEDEHLSRDLGPSSQQLSANFIELGGLGDAAGEAACEKGEHTQTRTYLEGNRHGYITQ